MSSRSPRLGAFFLLLLFLPSAEARSSSPLSTMEQAEIAAALCLHDPHLARLSGTTPVSYGGQQALAEELFGRAEALAMRARGGDQAALVEATAMFRALLDAAGLDEAALKVNAFAIAPFPADGLAATLTFEDSYPKVGDLDYNDFVVSLRVREVYGPDQGLRLVLMELRPLARGARDSHRLLLAPNGLVEGSRNAAFATPPALEGDASAALFRVAGEGVTVERHRGLSNVVIFPDTREALPPAPGQKHSANAVSGAPLVAPAQVAFLVLTPASPDRNLYRKRLQNGTPNPLAYRPVLRNLAKNADLDPHDGGEYPMALLIPGPWAWPLEHVPVTAAYPFFSDFVQSGFTKAKDWYLHPAPKARVFPLSP